MDCPIGNDNRMHTPLKGVLIGIYIWYTSEKPYSLYEEEKKWKNPRISAKQQVLLTKENNS